MPMPVLGTGSGIPLIRAISLHTPGLSCASCTPRPLQGSPSSAHPLKARWGGPQGGTLPPLCLHAEPVHSETY